MKVKDCNGCIGLANEEFMQRNATFLYTHFPKDIARDSLEIAFSVYHSTGHNLEKATQAIKDALKL